MNRLNNRNGVFVKESRRPTRVINLTSGIKTKTQPKIRLDKLVKIDNPSICIKRRLGGIGDVIMSTPLLAAIKRLLPNSFLIYATDLNYGQGALKEVIEHCPPVDQIVSSLQIDESEYDYSVDITTTGLSKEKSGTIPLNRIDMFADEVGISVGEDPVPLYIVTEEERAKAKEEIEKEYLDGRRREDVQIIAIQTRSNDARRTWPLSYMKELSTELSTNKDKVVLLLDWGSTVNEWTKKTRLFPVLNRTIADTAALIEQVDLVVCPDSSILHLAGALHKKIVSIFGPIPSQSRINHYENATAIQLNLPCKNCVTGDSYVLSDAGYKRIDQIKSGKDRTKSNKDCVLTTDGNLEIATELHTNDRNKRKLIEIMAFGSNEPITTTEDHKLLTTQKDFFYEKGRLKFNFTKPDWKEAKNISVKDYLCIPRPQLHKTYWLSEENPLLQSKDLAWLVGLFVAEGWTYIPKKGKTNRAYVAQFALSETETYLFRKIKAIIKKHPNIFFSEKNNNGFFSEKPNSKGKSIVVSISNKNFVTLLNQLFLEDEVNKAKNKKIPYQILTCSKVIITSFLQGYFDGDGYSGDKEIVYSTASRELAYGVQLLYARLGQLARIYKRTRDTNFKQNTVIYRIYVAKEIRYKRWYKNKNFLYTPVKEIKESERTDNKVYDITVENNPTFTIQNIAVLDCWYSPKCIKNSPTKAKLACLLNIKPKMVEKEIEQKLMSSLKPKRNIQYGRNLSIGNQDKIILVRRSTNGFGDLMMATNGIEALKVKYPDYAIHVAVKKYLHPVLKHNEAIDKVLDIDQAINNKRYKIILDISSPCSRYEIARLRMNKDIEKNRTEVFGEALGVRNLMKDILPRIHLTIEEKEVARKFLSGKINKAKKTIVLIMNSVEKYRDWPKENYSALIELLKEDFNIIISSSSIGDEIPDTISYRKVEFRETAAMIAVADGVITVDTGPLHIAAALDIQTIALFGPIDPRARCKGYKNTTVLTSGLKCIPCWRNADIKCKTLDKVDIYSQCMTLIPPKKVAKIAKTKFLKEKE